MNVTCTGTIFWVPAPWGLGVTYNQTGDLVMGVKESITIRFLRECGDLRWRAIKCVLVEFFEESEFDFFRFCCTMYFSLKKL